jgi:hypothetical protein
MSKNERSEAADPPPAYSLHNHACVTLNRGDRLRLIRFPPTIIDVVRQAITNSWPRGLQSEQDYSGAHEFKLNGNPWFGQGFDAVPSRIMMYHLILRTFSFS